MKSKPRFLLITLVIAIVILVGGLYLDHNQRTTASDQPSTDISLAVTQSQAVVIKFYYDSQDQLNSVAGELDIWEVHPLPAIGPGAGYAVAAVFPTQQDWLEVQGFRVEIDLEKTTQLHASTAALDPRYYYFDAYNNNANNLYMVNFLQNTSAAFPGITELLDIGDAWLATIGGYQRDIWVLRISNENPKYGEISSKPTFLLFANIHAREVTTPEMAIRYIKYLTMGYLGQGGYGLDPDVTWLVNHHAVYIMISINPDGRVINEANISALWRKNVDNNNGCGDPSSWGTDINRNSSFKWGCCGGSSGQPCSEVYRGPSRASEPETTAFQAFAATIFQDWNGNNGNDEIVPSPNNASGIFITLHAYADDILWPFGFNPGSAPNNAQLQTIGRKLADITGVMLPTGGIGYLVDGTSDDWVYGKLGVAAFTFEIGPNNGSCGGFFPAYGCQDGIDGMPRNFWAEMKTSFVYANKIAATPYITSYGPDARNLLENLSNVPAGSKANLSGTILDQRYSGDPLVPVVAAEYFIDAPGADGTGNAMSPFDGAWGETTENVQAVVDTTGLQKGQHYILVHGMNEDGIWGPFTAIFLNISEPLAPLAEFTSNSPVPLGDPINFINQTIGTEPISYTWDFGDDITSTEVNPSHIYYPIGIYTVTLVAENTFGTDSISHTVNVESGVITSVDLTQVTSGSIFVGDIVNYSADLLPDHATEPFYYTLDLGDTTVIKGTSEIEPILFSHVFTSGGGYTVQISVNSDLMSDPVSDSLDIYVNFYKLFFPITIK